jgi:hypothetical protein
MHKKWYHEGQLKTFLVLFLLTEVLSKGNARVSPGILDAAKQPS